MFEGNVMFEHVMFESCALATSTDSPSIEKDAIRGTANDVPATSVLRKSRRPASTLLRTSSFRGSGAMSSPSAVTVSLSLR